MRLINRKRSEKTVVAVRLGRKRRAEWPLLKQLARDNNHRDAFNSIPCTLQSPPGLCDMQAWDNPEGLVVKLKYREESKIKPRWKTKQAAGPCWLRLPAPQRRHLSN
ncbi:mCG5020 [Mus musculus]|uniref:Uncharacterized protein n=1 Tax=Mus musculus TaxID=10090 RepID=Q9D5M9_MOUSE|nr:mCG5020 [Mus musculus]BAB29720.1 unnamed protein product [Mus musculus]BAC26528.1 unnamed protein product [Mus musculus]